MNKTELAAAVAAKTELSKKDAEAAVNAVLASITDALAEGDKVALVGFGTFDVKTRAARTGLNPPHQGDHPDSRGKGSVLQGRLRA